VAAANEHGRLLRAGEMALRFSLGARRGRLVRLVMAESVMLGLNPAVGQTHSSRASAGLRRRFLRNCVDPDRDADVRAVSYAAQLGLAQGQLATGVFPSLL
jgi:hypothetical protein